MLLISSVERDERGGANQKALQRLSAASAMPQPAVRVLFAALLRLENDETGD